MRIRKRKVPLPLSLLSPVPLTDPHLFSRSPVQPPAYDNNLTCSSDHFTITPTCCSDSFASDLLLRLAATPTHHGSLPITGVDEGVQMSNNYDASNATTTTTTTATRCAPAYHNNDNPNTNTNTTNNNRPLLLSLSNNEGGWCDGDRAIPLKKRRTMIMKCDVVESGSSLGKKDEEVKSTVTSDQTSAINDDCNNNNNNNSKQEVVAVAAAAAATSAKKGNSKRGNTIMEGSRCSRVNGRGWRCCQPTLVGYSLCEHHLGKGRLRSMATTAKARSSTASTKKNNNANNNNNSFAIGDREERETVDGKDNNEKKMDRMGSFGNNNNNNNNSKRAKLGVVKARSLSSLLGQTNTMNNNIVGDHANVHQQEGNNN